jgi:protein-S-isoprenylcysteine O-methyltransferase Ste14
LPESAPLVIGYALWVVFALSWNMSGRLSGIAPTVATPHSASERASRWGTGGRGERLHGVVIALGLAMIVTAPAMLPGGAMWMNRPLLDWAMLLVIAGGIAFCWWARLHLARLWSPSVTRKEGHRIVDTGPYRLVRHPIYAGFVLIYFGLAILCRTALALLGTAMMILGLWLKARVEERFLIQELGSSAYDSYKARTPMLVPRMPPWHRQSP